jgi:ribosomal protein S18 acetylase RimI-like enzyme
MEEEFILSLLPQGNIIFAIDSSNNHIAGLASFGKITKNYSRESWNESETTTNRKWRDILKFMSHIESKSNVCERFGVTQALHLHGVTVDKAYRGRSIGKRLFIECFDIAKGRNYQLVSADCTSVYSIHIAKSVGMELVSTVTYDEYHEKVGEKIFTPIEPHTEIKSFVKRI